MSDYTNKKGKTLLHTAAEHGKMAFKTIHLRHELIASEWIGIKSVAEKVIKGGAIIDATDVFGKTPLHYAAENGKAWSLDMSKNMRHASKIRLVCVLFWSMNAKRHSFPHILIIDRRVRRHSWTSRNQWS